MFIYAVYHNENQRHFDAITFSGKRFNGCTAFIHWQGSTLVLSRWLSRHRQIMIWHGISFNQVFCQCLVLRRQIMSAGFYGHDKLRHQILKQSNLWNADQPQTRVVWEVWYIALDHQTQIASPIQEMILAFKGCSYMSCKIKGRPMRWLPRRPRKGCFALFLIACLSMYHVEAKQRFAQSIVMFLVHISLFLRYCDRSMAHSHHFGKPQISPGGHSRI